jgi:hypothetical protein
MTPAIRLRTMHRLMLTITCVWAAVFISAAVIMASPMILAMGVAPFVSYAIFVQIVGGLKRGSAGLR